MKKFKNLLLLGLLIVSLFIGLGFHTKQANFLEGSELDPLPIEWTHTMSQMLNK